jgi:hypothetical protein
MRGRSSSMTASRSTMLARMTAWWIERPLAAMLARISSVSCLSNWSSSR